MPKIDRKLISRKVDVNTDFKKIVKADHVRKKQIIEAEKTKLAETQKIKKAF